MDNLRKQADMTNRSIVAFSELRLNQAESGRLLAKIGRSDACWTWAGAKSSRTGYGVFAYRGTTIAAHRAVYLHLVGPIAEGLQLDHLCRNRGCVNPDHLEPVTAAENAVRSPLRVRPACPYGHLFEGDNLRTYASDSAQRRYCRTCQRARWRKAAAKRRAASRQGG